MNRFFQFFQYFLLLLALGGVAAPAAAQVGARAYAPENLRTLSRPRTWQSQPGQVYVDQGCRAEFGAARLAPNPGLDQAIRCESTDSRHRTCNTPWRGVSRLQRQVSGAACIQNRSWGSTPGQVWVSQGCRGDFLAGAAVGGSYSVTCSSTGLASTTCAWDRSRGRPRLLQQLSAARCTEGTTWGYNNRRGLWVSGGCRARFGAGSN